MDCTDSLCFQLKLVSDKNFNNKTKYKLKQFGGIIWLTSSSASAKRISASRCKVKRAAWRVWSSLSWKKQKVFIVMRVDVKGL